MAVSTMTDQLSEIVEIVNRWRSGEDVVIATVVRTWRSSPRPAGAMMAVTSTGEVIGSITGGCVEGAAYQVATEILAGAPSRRTSWGVTDDDALEVGLICGGTVEVHFEMVGDELGSLLERLIEVVGTGRSAALISHLSLEQPGHVVVTDEDVLGAFGGHEITSKIIDEARSILAAGGEAQEISISSSAVFVLPFGRRRAMYIFGSIDYAAALAEVGTFLGFEVVVCDPRAVFTTERRFPSASQVVVQWPHVFLETAPIDGSTAICVLTHDPKYDVPALTVSLRSPAGYVGAMGSRSTTLDRERRLREVGLGDEELSRLRAPIGLDLQGSTPQETALAIAAEIVAVLNGGSAVGLTEIDGPIHSGSADRC